MEFVILNTVSQHGLSTESSIVWVKHSVEHLILYGKSHVNLYYLYYFIFEWFDFFFVLFPFFLGGGGDGVTLNPNITKQEGTAFFAKKVVLLLARITTCKYSVCLQTQA